jgi:hypothetical protein
MRTPRRVLVASLTTVVASLLVITSSGAAHASTTRPVLTGTHLTIQHTMGQTSAGTPHVLLPAPLPSPPGSPTIICCGGGGYSYPPSSPYYGEYQWTSSRGTQVVYRKGQWSSASPDRGFGQAKVHGKHGLYRADLIGYTVEHAMAVPQGGGRYRYVQTFESQYGRYITIVVATQEQQILKDGFPFGVITAFCNGYDPTCPAWVNIVGFNPA